MRKLLSTVEDKRIRSSLVASIFDGSVWAVMYGFAEYFILPFALFFGASTFQTSLVQGMGQLGVAVAQIAGASLVVKIGSRRRLSKICVAFHAASWIAAFWLVAWTKDPWTVVITYSIGVVANNIGAPGWQAWMNDIVPPAMRGSYWGKRTMIIGLVELVAIGIAGFALYEAAPSGKTLVAFGVLFTLAAISRSFGIVALSHQYEPPMKSVEKPEAFHLFVASLHTNKLGGFVLFSVFMSFAVNIMSPLVSVYLLRSLNAGYFEYTAVTMAYMVLSNLLMDYWGPLADRYGNRRVLLVTSAALPLLSFGWIFAKSFPAMLAVQVFSGFVWAGVNLCTTNYIYDSVPGSKIASTAANFNALNNACAFAGSIAGGLLATLVADFKIPFFAAGNLELLFLLSGLLRLLVLVVFGRKFPEVRPVESSPSIVEFYVYEPFNRMKERVVSFSGRRRI